MDILQILWLLGFQLKVYAEVLTFQGQGLTSVPPNISEAAKDLSFLGNAITTIQPSDFNDKYPDLTYLHLGYNDITSIERGCFRGTIIKDLSLHYNELTIIPDLQELQSTLKVLKLGHNKISSILIGDLNYLTQLGHVNLDYNTITSVTDGCFGGTRLWNINLEGNQLVDFPDIRAVNITLKILNVAENAIAVIPEEEIDNLEILESLSLTGNPISCLPEFTLLLPSLTTLAVQQLPLQCCCMMAWMKELSESFSIEMDTRPCVSPSKWNQIPWDQITGEMLRREPCEIDASHWIRCLNSFIDILMIEEEINVVPLM
ncbi:hypothetical protein CAPTEDRAFT_217378 [Capitella teleta]|uniref:LRRCT domain-containing protein n=1 Tax=Capitella teleta TaxID=283909 RepID=R7TA76_CAPTE|nr:hypothetical protein CAPTEDRAFT_217378 [Capitella teleta]|eukprot:ELT90382.1 hypothetical protein CAPTEDRAFT_217378 [Capitella teleta]